MTTSPQSPETARPILIVDDDVTFARMLREVLESWNLPNPIHHLLDGAMLLEYLTVCFTLGAWVQPLPQLVILDYNMPNIDGPEVMRSLKKAGADHLRVIVASGSDPAKVVAKFKKFDVHHFASKPLEAEDYEQIKKALGIAAKTE